jgi:hypothetical protein
MGRVEQRQEAAKQYAETHKEFGGGIAYLMHMDATEWADRTTYEYIHEWLTTKIDLGYNAIDILRSFEWEYPDKVLK